MLALFTLGRLELNASGNSIIFVFVGLIIVIMQGAYSGEIVQRFRLMSASKERSRTGKIIINQLADTGTEERSLL